jgi:general secretion pathway protein F
MFARMGEQTGQLPRCCSARPTSCRRKCSAGPCSWPRLLEPLLIVGMGLVVMLIVLAVLLPIIQLNQWVK